MAERELQAYYARDEERDRLGRGLGRVELLRTTEVVSRTLPPPPATVADVGGGPGRYTDWLVDAGYTVIHRDLVAHHVDQVAARHGSSVDTAVGDARALDLSGESVDAVLLLGPLYHLEAAADRNQALAEARRVVRAGGSVYAAAITRWSGRLHGLLVDRMHEVHPAAVDAIEVMEATGELRPFHEASFNGYAHTPAELAHEITASDLDLVSLVALEGLSFALCDLDERLDDPVQRELLLDTLRAVEAVPDLMGLGPHLLATARKQVP